MVLQDASSAIHPQALDRTMPQQHPSSSPTHHQAKKRDRKSTAAAPPYVPVDLPAGPPSPSSPHKLPRLSMYDTYQPWVLHTYGDSAKTKTITKNKYQRILQILRGDYIDNETSKFKLWVKGRGFRIGPPPGYLHGGDGHALLDYNPDKDPTPDIFVQTGTVKDPEGNDRISYKKVAVVEDFFDIIYNLHVCKEGKDQKHMGQKRTYRAVSERYAFVPREAVTKFLVLCTECPRRSSASSAAAAAAAAAAAHSGASSLTAGHHHHHNNNNSSPSKQQLTTINGSNSSPSSSSSASLLRSNQLTSAFQPIHNSRNNSNAKQQQQQQQPPLSPHHHHPHHHPHHPHHAHHHHTTPHSIMSFLPSPTSITPHSISSLLPSHTVPNSPSFPSSPLGGIPPQVVSHNTHHSSIIPFAHLLPLTPPPLPTVIPHISPESHVKSRTKSPKKKCTSFVPTTDLTPPARDLTPPALVLTPPARELTPGPDLSSPAPGRLVSSSHELTPPARELTYTPTREQTYTPSRELTFTPTREQTYTPARDQTYTPSRNLTPPAREPTPQIRELTPIARELTPPARELTPQAREVTPTPAKVTSPTGEITPELPSTKLNSTSISSELNPPKRSLDLPRVEVTAADGAKRRKLREEEEVKQEQEEAAVGAHVSALSSAVNYSLPFTTIYLKEMRSVMVKREQGVQPMECDEVKREHHWRNSYGEDTTPSNAGGADTAASTVSNSNGGTPPDTTDDSKTDKTEVRSSDWSNKTESTAESPACPPSPSLSDPPASIADDSSTGGGREDDDEDEDGEEERPDPHHDPERLKAFNMFVRLFVDENLDRIVPISKQPKEKIQAIIDACGRQFPEFSERTRKRIRTYLKSCRRNKRTRDGNGWTDGGRPTPPHLTSLQAEQLLATACDNEAQNAKRMRLGLEPVAQPHPYAQVNAAVSAEKTNHSLMETVPVTNKNDISAVKSVVETKIMNGTSGGGLATVSNATNIVYQPSSCSASATPYQNTYQQIYNKPATANGPTDLSMRGTPVTHAISTTAPITSTMPTGALTLLPQTTTGPSLLINNNTSIAAIPNSTVVNANNILMTNATTLGGGIVAASPQTPINMTQHTNTPVNMTQQNTLPVNMTQQTTSPVNMSQQQQSTGIKARPTLSPVEVAAVRQLITGYRESAAFLLRSAEELQNLIQQQQQQGT